MSERDGRLNNPYMANNRGAMSWHPYFSVTRRSSERSPFWPACSKAVGCTHPDGMGHRGDCLVAAST